MVLIHLRLKARIYYGHPESCQEPPGAARIHQEPPKVVLSCEPSEQFLEIDDFAIFSASLEILFR